MSRSVQRHSIHIQLAIGNKFSIADTTLDSLTESVQTYLATLGLKTNVQLVIAFTPREKSNIIRVAIDNKYCPLPDAYLHAASAYAYKRPLMVPEEKTIDWLSTIAESTEHIEVFLRHLLENLIGTWANLFTPSAANLAGYFPDYLIKRYGITDSCNILTTLLELGVALPSRNYWEQLNEAPEEQKDGSNSAVLRELLLSELMQKAVYITFNPRYLQTLSLEIEKLYPKQNPFELLRKQFFYITGINLPTFRIKLDSGLAYQEFTITINQKIAWRGFGIIPEVRFVNIEAQHLRGLGFSAHSAIHPETQQSAAIVDEHSALQLAGTYRIFTPLEYLVLCANSCLLQHRRYFVERKLVEQSIADLSQNLSKHFTSALNSAISLSKLTQTLRILAHEDISLRHFAEILECILEADSITMDEKAYITIADRRLPLQKVITPNELTPELLARYVRKQLGVYITQQLFPNRKISRAIGFKPDIIQQLNKGNNFSGDLYESLIFEAEQLVEGIPPAQRSDIVFHASLSHYQQLRDMMLKRFPKIPFLVSQELRKMTVQHKNMLSIEN